MLEITISYTEDGLFGQNPDNREGVNIKASFEEFERQVISALQEEYDAVTTIRNGIEDSCNVSPNIDDIERDVEQTMHNVWESWDWVVRE